MREYKRTWRWSDFPFASARRQGRACCIICGGPLPGRRSSYCSSVCVDEYLIRTNPGHLRAVVKRRDKGVCAYCGIDTGALKDRLVQLWRRNPQWFAATAMRRLNLPKSGSIYVQMGGSLEPPFGALWHADHIIRVVDGGGGCGLNNIQSLCWRCHAKKHRRKGRSTISHGRAITVQGAVEPPDRAS